MIKVTYAQVLEFRQKAYIWTKEHAQRTKFHYALEKILKKTVKLEEEYTDKRNEILNNYANTEKDGTLIIKEGQLLFSVENSKKRNKAMRELGDTVVEVEEYISPFVPPLTSEYVLAFCPFVLKEDEGEENLLDKETLKTDI